MKHIHIQEIVRTESDAVKVQAIETIDSIIDAIPTGPVSVTGDVSSPSVLFGDDNSDVVIPVTVLPEGHNHTKSTLDIDHTSAPNKIVVRDTSGNIHSSGSSVGNTGYKLINNNDITTLFQDINNTNITVTNINSNSPSGQNAITNLQLEYVGYQVRLHRTYGWVCNCNYSWYCKCCC